MNYNLDRFKKAQDDSANSYRKAFQEITNGRKESHWIWYIFPQLASLGFSSNAKYYGIKDLEEAKAYLNDDLLKERLLEISKALLTHDKSAHEIFGSPDDMKVQSCMTLFTLSDPDICIFKDVLDKFYAGNLDNRTVEEIEKHK